MYAFPINVISPLLYVLIILVFFFYVNFIPCYTILGVKSTLSFSFLKRKLTFFYWVSTSCCNIDGLK